MIHELKNQVTMEWWDQVWLYEGFTNWIKYYGIHKTAPHKKIWTNFLCNEYVRAMSMDALANSYPIEVSCM